MAPEAGFPPNTNGDSKAHGGTGAADPQLSRSGSPATAPEPAAESEATPRRKSSMPARKGRLAWARDSELVETAPSNRRAASATQAPMPQAPQGKSANIWPKLGATRIPEMLAGKVAGSGTARTASTSTGASGQTSNWDVFRSVSAGRGGRRRFANVSDSDTGGGGGGGAGANDGAAVLQHFMKTKGVAGPLPFSTPASPLRQGSLIKSPNPPSTSSNGGHAPTKSQNAPSTSSNGGHVPTKGPNAPSASLNGGQLPTKGPNASTSSNSGHVPTSSNGAKAQVSVGTPGNINWALANGFTWAVAAPSTSTSVSGAQEVGSGSAPSSLPGGPVPSAGPSTGPVRAAPTSNPRPGQPASHRGTGDGEATTSGGSGQFPRVLTAATATSSSGATDGAVAGEGHGPGLAGGPTSPIRAVLLAAKPNAKNTSSSSFGAVEGLSGHGQPAAHPARPVSARPPSVPSNTNGATDLGEGTGGATTRAHMFASRSLIAKPPGVSFDNDEIVDEPEISVSPRGIALRPTAHASSGRPPRLTSIPGGMVEGAESTGRSVSPNQWLTGLSASGRSRSPNFPGTADESNGGTIPRIPPAVGRSFNSRPPSITSDAGGLLEGAEALSPRQGGRPTSRPHSPGEGTTPAATSIPILPPSHQRLFGRSTSRPPGIVAQRTNQGAASRLLNDFMAALGTSGSSATSPPARLPSDRRQSSQIDEDRRLSTQHSGSRSGSFKSTAPSSSNHSGDQEAGEIQPSSSTAPPPPSRRGPTVPLSQVELGPQDDAMNTSLHAKDLAMLSAGLPAVERRRSRGQRNASSDWRRNEGWMRPEERPHRQVVLPQAQHMFLNGSLQDLCDRLHRSGDRTLHLSLASVTFHGHLSPSVRGNITIRNRLVILHNCMLAFRQGQRLCVGQGGRVVLADVTLVSLLDANAEEASSRQMSSDSPSRRGSQPPTSRRSSDDDGVVSSANQALLYVTAGGRVLLRGCQVKTMVLTQDASMATPQIIQMMNFAQNSMAPDQQVGTIPLSAVARPPLHPVPAPLAIFIEAGSLVDALGCTLGRVNIVGPGSRLSLRHCRLLPDRPFDPANPPSGTAHNITVRRESRRLSVLQSSLPPMLAAADGGVVDIDHSEIKDGWGMGIAIRGAATKVTMQHSMVASCRGIGVLVTTPAFFVTSFSRLIGNTGAGILIRGAGASGEIRECEFMNNHGENIAVIGSASAVMHSCVAIGSRHGCGLLVEGAGSRMQAANCAFDGNGTNGVRAASNGHVEMRDCSSSRNCGTGMEVEGDLDPADAMERMAAVTLALADLDDMEKPEVVCTFAGGQLAKNGGHGCSVRNGGGLLLCEGCELSQNVRDGIYIEGLGTGIQMEEISTRGNGESGVFVCSGALATMVNCKMGNNLYGDIAVGGRCSRGRLIGCSFDFNLMPCLRVHMGAKVMMNKCKMDSRSGSQDVDTGKEGPSRHETSDGAGGEAKPGSGSWTVGTVRSEYVQLRGRGSTLTVDGRTFTPNDGLEDDDKDDEKGPSREKSYGDGGAKGPHGKRALADKRRGVGFASDLMVVESD